MQHQLRLLDLTSSPERETSSSDCSEAYVGYIQSAMKSFQDLIMCLEGINENNAIQELVLKPFEEPKLMKRLGKLKGIVQANQFISIPRQPVEIMIMKLARKIILRELELQDEVLFMGEDYGNIAEKICCTQLEIAKKYSEISEEYIRQSIVFMQGEETQISDSASAKATILLRAFMTMHQELFLRLIQQMVAVAQENTYNENILQTVHHSARERILELLNEIEGFISAEGVSISHTTHLPLILFDLTKAFLQKEHKLTDVACLLKERHQLQIRRIVDTQSGVGKELDQAYQNHLSRIADCMILENYKQKIEFLQIEYERLRNSLVSIIEAMVKVPYAMTSTINVSLFFSGDRYHDRLRSLALAGNASDVLRLLDEFRSTPHVAEIPSETGYPGEGGSTSSPSSSSSLWE